MHDIYVSLNLSRDHRDHHERGHIYSLWCLVVHGVQWPHCVQMSQRLRMSRMHLTALRGNVTMITNDPRTLVMVALSAMAYTHST